MFCVVYIKRTYYDENCGPKKEEDYCCLGKTIPGLGNLGGTDMEEETLYPRVSLDASEVDIVVSPKEESSGGGLFGLGLF